VSGSEPAGTLLHVPSEPATAHDWQVPVQAVAQQTFCEQMPLTHSPPAAQVVPLSFFPHAPLTHTFGDEQWASIVHVVRQAPVPQAKGTHGDEVAVWQIPLPLHDRAAVTIDPVQVAAMHSVPAAYRRQAPDPLQDPSVLQLAVPRAAHWLNGSCPSATLVQVPSVPASAHDWQVPLQTLLQQIPCAQNPLLHSPAAPQVAPFDFLTQLPPMHENGATQSALIVQEVWQEPVPQT